MRAAAVGLLLLTRSLLAAEPGDPRPLAVPEDKRVRAVALVRQLDDNDVNVRDRATDELAKLGRFAFPTVRETLAGKPSAEVRSRIERLILAPVAADDFRARYPVFLADKARKYDHDFFGWTELKGIAGDTEHSRALFADMLAEEKTRTLLLAAALPQADALAAFNARWIAFGPRLEKGKGYVQDTPPLPDFAALLLAQTITRGRPEKFDPSRASRAINAALVSDEGKRAASGEGRYGPVFQAVCLQWTETREDLGSHRLAELLTQRLNLGLALKTEIHRRIITDPATPPASRQMQLLLLAGAGGQKHLDLFRQYLKDESVISPNTPDHQMQVRDMALCAAILVTGQRPKEYGFTVVIGEVPDHLLMLHNYIFKEGKGKTVDDLRQAAFAKWAEWEKDRPKPDGK